MGQRRPIQSFAEPLERRVLLSGILFPGQSMPVGKYPHDLTIADVNGDGKPDLLTANAGADSISILLGNGDGTFQPQTTVGFSFAFTEFAAADVNGDGKSDLILPDASGNDVEVLLSNGNGTFQSPQSFYAFHPVTIAMADLTGDGDTDIITGSGGSELPEFTVLLGNGNGTFAPAQSVANPANTEIHSLAVTDVNGDGIPDIVAFCGSAQVSVLLGNGNGTFKSGRILDAGSGGIYYTLAVGDINGDGKTDILAGYDLFLGNGDGTFKAPLATTVGALDSAVELLSVPGSPRPNIVMGSQGTHSYSSVIVATVSPSGVITPQQTLTIGPGVGSIALGDLNGDGNTDIAVINLIGSVEVVSVLPGNGNGTFPGVTGVGNLGPTGLPAEAGSYAVGDLNGDGKADLVIGAYTNQNTYLEIMLGNGNGTFQPSQSVAVTTSKIGAITAADINGDGKLDLVAAEGDSIDVFLGNGNGTFKAAVPLATTDVPTTIKMEDLNGDGKGDLIVSYQYKYAVSVFLGNGNGTFQTSHTYAIADPEKSLAVADFNGDGNPDIVVAVGYTSHYLDVLFGNGNGTFSPAKTIGSRQFEEVAAADLNGDGRMDIVASYLGTVDILLGNGNGTFQPAHPATSFATGTTTIGGLALADLNGDGITDIITGDGDTSVLLGNGNGTFQRPINIPTGNGPVGVSAANIFGNPNPDIVLFDSGIGILPNLTTPISQTPSKLAFNQQPTATSVGGTISPAVTVDIENSTGGIVTTANSEVTISIDTPNPTGAKLGGTLSVQAINGVATFGNLTLNTAGQYTLKATDGSIPYVTSGSFTVGPVSNGPIIVDDKQATLVGAWTSSTYTPGYYGTDYLTDGNTGKGTKSATFTPDLPTAGTYNVYARWTAGTNRANKVPFIVTSASGSTTVYENQQTQNGTWVLLGSYSFNAGTGGNVKISNAGTTGYVIADAIEFVPVTPIIVDNNQATLTGTWTSSTYTPGYYGTDYLTDGNTGKGTKTATFTPNLPTTGTYNVYALWTAGTNRATNVPFDILHQGITTTVLEDQQINGGQWVLLGTYTFNAGTGGSVTIRTTGTNGYVIANAVEFVPIS